MDDIEKYLRRGSPIWREGGQPANGVISDIRWRDEEVVGKFDDDYDVFTFSSLEWTESFGGFWMVYKEQS